jgi:Protein of unknown function (DUF1579)
MTIRTTIRGVAAVLAGVCFAATTLASPQHTEMPKPGPEAKKLEVFAGKWKGESTMQPGPWGPGGKMTSMSDCTWYDGGFQMICRDSSEGALGKMKSEAILGWNGEEKAYKYMGFDSMGMMGQATGTVSGNTWSWAGEDKMGGKLIKSKYTIVMVTPTSQSFKWETSDDGGKTWKLAAEGKSTKK